ncbi:MAG: GNAT family N-acetyltransferase [Rhodospirillaceae bacterium]|nr:GNAT family N-acetyltransferase [Rhodospirillaceae bacterium]
MRWGRSPRWRPSAQRQRGHTVFGFRSHPRPRLVADRVYLRYPLLSDWRAWAELRDASRAFLTPWEPTWPPDALERNAFRRRLRRQYLEIEQDRGYPFFIFDLADNRLLGGVSLSNVRRGVTQAGTVGYWIGAEHACQGYMTEAVCAIVGFAFSGLKLHRVDAICIPDNRPSRRLLEHLGFEEEGRVRGALKINGAWRDHVSYAILRDDPASPVPRPRPVEAAAARQRV